jgi:hypothetical protein
MKVQVFYVKAESPTCRSLAMEGKGLPMPLYRYVATLEVADLEAAFDATQNVYESWTKGAAVTESFGEERSSCVGDLFETPDGLFVVQPAGFKRWEDVKAARGVTKAVAEVFG